MSEPTFAEIAEWLREAGELCWTHYGASPEAKKKIRVWAGRAAQVEAMGDDRELLTIAYMDGFEQGKKAIENKWASLYNRVNEMMAHMGAYGEVDTQSAVADRVMGALAAIDGGTYKPMTEQTKG